MNSRIGLVGLMGVVMVLVCGCSQKSDLQGARITLLEERQKQAETTAHESRQQLSDLAAEVRALEAGLSSATNAMDRLEAVQAAQWKGTLKIVEALQEASSEQWSHTLKIVEESKHPAAARSVER